MAKGGIKPLRETGPTPAQRRVRLLGIVGSILVHVLIVGAIIWPRAAPPARIMQAPMQVRLVESSKPEPPGPPDLPPEDLAAPVAPPAPRVPVVTIAAPDNSDLLSEAQLAGAAVAGEGMGGGGGNCDIARLLQQALRRDPLVRAAVMDAGRLGKAVMLWNGDWVRTGGQEGKGLSAVREAVIWELAFVPEVCRNRRLHGLVVLSLTDTSTRFAIGANDWRWSDLLGLRRQLVR